MLSCHNTDMLTGTLTVIIRRNEMVTEIGKEKGIANTEREVVKTGKILESFKNKLFKKMSWKPCAFEVSILVEGKVYCLTVL